MAATYEVERASARHTITYPDLTTATNTDVRGTALQVAAVVGSVQVTGTFGGATVTLLGSNDGTNYVAVANLAGDAISFTAAGVAEFTSGMAYLKPSLAGGTGDDITVTIVIWAF